MRFFLSLILISAFSFAFSQQPKNLSNDDSGYDRIADNIINNLTLNEKVSLLLYNSPAIPRLNIVEYNWWNEALHGVARAGKATVFPQAIGLAATFDPELMTEISTAIANEARAKHNEAVKKGSREQYTGLTFWSPNINIFRDPRWGRGQETYGEDPFLTSVMGTAFVKGLQGKDKNRLKAAACAKHFAVHSGPEESRHRINIKPSKYDLWETYLPAFKALVQNGVEAVMCAYNRVNNEPCCANGYLLDTVLRQQWGFKGHVVSDCWALDDIWARHKVTDDKVKAAVMAAKAGVNLNCGYLFKFLPEGVSGNLLTEKDIDAILKPLLITRLKLGILTENDKTPYDNIAADTVNCKYHRELAKKAALESIVLLKNDDSILPLNKNKVKKIFVTGPTANDNTVLLGNYNGFSGNMVTILEGIINKVDAGTVVNYAIGTELKTDINSFNGTWQASSADYTIACVGNSRFLEGENGDAFLNENGGDRKNLRLPDNQINFIKELRKKSKNKPLIVVITGGSAISIPEIKNLADAVIFVWYPGEQGGNAVADVLFGDYSPSGKLPVTFYKSVKDLPPFDDYSMKGRTYRYFKGKPMYEFGYGLGYTTFKYTGLHIKSNNKTLNISFIMENTGKMDGADVPQVYIKYKTDISNKKLVGFKRVFLKKGEKKEVVISIPKSNLTLWNENTGKVTNYKGEAKIEVGTSSEDIKLERKISL